MFLFSILVETKPYTHIIAETPMYTRNTVRNKSDSLCLCESARYDSQSMPLVVSKVIIYNEAMLVHACAPSGVATTYDAGGRRLIDCSESHRPDTSTCKLLDFLRKAIDVLLCIIMIPPENIS